MEGAVTQSRSARAIGGSMRYTSVLKLNVRASRSTRSVKAFTAVTFLYK